jgi:hypothetical protein
MLMEEIKMYEHETFEQVGNIEPGELVMKLPGTDVKMLYSQGEAFVNSTGDVGYNALNVTDMVAEEAGEAEGMFGILGKQLREQLSDPRIKPLLREIFAQDSMYLFVSKGTDGRTLLTIPSMTDEGIDDENLAGFVLGGYSTAGGSMRPVDNIYAFHSQVTAGRELVSDRATLEREVLTLVPTANGVYEKALEAMRSSGF